LTKVRLFDWLIHNPTYSSLQACASLQRYTAAT